MPFKPDPPARKEAQIQRVLRATCASGHGRVGGMALAQIGSLTGVLEALAAAVGAGAVLGGVAAGIQGMVRGSPRADIEESALAGGYIGGGVGAALAFVDLILRYALAR